MDKKINLKGLVVALSFVSLLASCSHIQSRREEGVSSSDSANDFGGSDAAKSGEASTPPAAIEEKRVAVILGPGGYKAFAHAGVLKELKKKNVPIHAVVGLEWGAMVAGLFAQRGQVNEAEWKLYKLEKVDLDNTGFFGRKAEPQSLKILDDFLKENLDVKDTSQVTVPFFCPSLALNQGTLTWQDKGPLAQAVTNCLAYPPLYTPQRQFVAGLFSLEEVISRLKREKMNVIILIDVLSGGDLFDNSKLKEDYASVVLWNEVRRALWQAKSSVTDVIEVNTRGVHISDFESRKLLVTAGEASGERAAKQLVNKYGF